MSGGPDSPGGRTALASAGTVTVVAAVTTAGTFRPRSSGDHSVTVMTGVVETA